MVVLVKRTENGFDWHEIPYSSQAKYNAADVDWDRLKSQCGLDVWRSIPGMAKGCPARDVDVNCQYGTCVIDSRH